MGRRGSLPIRRIVSSRPWDSATPIMTCTPLPAAWMAASSMAYVLPTPGAMPKKIFSRPRPGRDSSLRMEARILSARWLSECVSENMKKGNRNGIRLEC